MSGVLGGVCAAAMLLGTAAHAQDPVKIGFITELTGPWNFTAASCVAGLKLAEVNLNPPGKRRIEFVMMDNQTQPAQAVAAARNLDVQSKVLAFSGPTSSDTALAIYGYAEQNKVPFLVPVAAFPQLTKPGTRYTFRIEPDAAGWGYAIAKFLEQKKPGAKVALLYSDYALMRAIAAGLKWQAPKSGIKVEPEIVFPQGSNDATVQAAQVRASGADFVVWAGAGAFEASVTGQLLDIGIKPEQIIHPYGFTSLIRSWGKRSAGSYYGTFFDANLDHLTDEGKKFVDDFTKQNDRMPSYTENYCYVTAQIFREVLDKNPQAADDREKFRDALSSYTGKESTSGVPISFDKNGARKEYMYFMQVGDIGPKEYKAKQTLYIEWDPEVLPVYDLVK
jgi:ABC-type branched-subunit amino acid transport system substrate-binding protein